MSRIRTILHPTDFSRASAPAFKRAVQMAKDNRAQLLILHVLAPASPMLMTDGYVPPKVYDDMEAAARAEAQKARGEGEAFRGPRQADLARGHRPRADHPGGALSESRPGGDRHPRPDRLRAILPG